jgi:stage IV sporulation protein FB
VLAGSMLLAGMDREMLVFNPFKPLETLGKVQGSFANVVLWSAYYANWLILAFNVIVPMFPMDGGRLWQAVLWRRMGFGRSMMVAVTVGLAAAIALGIVAIAAQSAVLIAIAFFGGLTCYVERQRLRFAADPAGEDESPCAASLRLRPDDEDEPGAVDKEAERRAEAERLEREAVDRILEKIRVSGRDSLTRKERATLERARENLRRRG